MTNPLNILEIQELERRLGRHQRLAQRLQEQIDVLKNEPFEIPADIAGQVSAYFKLAALTQENKKFEVKDSHGNIIHPARIERVYSNEAMWRLGISDQALNIAHPETCGPGKTGFFYRGSLWTSDGSVESAIKALEEETGQSYEQLKQIILENELSRINVPDGKDPADYQAAVVYQVDKMMAKERSNQ